MDWRDIGALVKPFAPVLGGILGGPLGGIAGSLLGSLIPGGSGDGGVITPDTVKAAIEKGGDAVMAGIQAAEQEAQARWGYLTEAIKADRDQGLSINETIRSENAQGVSWWHWRHLIGYCLLPWMIVPLPTIAVALYRGDQATVNNVLALAAALLPYLTIFAALLGYVATDTTRRMTTAMVGEHAPSIIGTIAKAVTKR